MYFIALESVIKRGYEKYNKCNIQSSKLRNFTIVINYKCNTIEFYIHAPTY